MVFGRIYDLEPQPQFFNVKQFKEEGFSRYKKAKRGVKRGVVLFVDPPEIKYKEVRRRPFSGSGGINAKVRANPQMANFYQLNKIALSQMNKKIIERKQNEMDPLKMAELALLAKINENLEKKETAVSIAQTEPPEDEPEMVDRIIQAQSDLGNIEEENKVLQEQLKQTRQQLNTLTQEKKAVEEDEARDIKVMEQFETEMLNERARFNEEIVNRNNQFIQDRMAVFETPKPSQPSLPARPQEPLERVGAEQPIETLPEPEPIIEEEPEKRSVAEKIEFFGGGGAGLPETERLLEEGEAILTEAQERAYMEKIGKAEKKKQSKRSPLEQQMIDAKRNETRFTNELKDTKRLTKRNKKAIPKMEERIIEIDRILTEEIPQMPTLNKQQKSNKTRRTNQLIYERSKLGRDITEAQGQIANSKARKKMLKERIKSNQERRKELLEKLEEEDQLKAVREEEVGGGSITGML